MRAPIARAGVAARTCSPRKCSWSSTSCPHSFSRSDSSSSRGSVGDGSDLSLEVEQLTFHFLPGDVFLAKKTPALWLQPDLRIDSPHVHCFVEAKRIKRGAFQPEQLAREYLAVVQEAELCNQKPLLLLVLPASPPVRVSKHRPLDISKAIKTALASVLSRCEHEFSSVETLEKGIDSVVSYITWPAVIEAISAARDECSLGNGSVDASVKRIANAALSAIDWHS